jgi:hypothetical protein
MNCQFCGSQLPPNADKCPQCGASQGSGASIPPPSPYYEEVIPSTPPVVEIPEKPIPPEPELATVIPTIIASAIPNKGDRSVFALIALILGIIGVPVALSTAGCSSVMNLVGIFLAWMGLKSGSRGMAKVALVLNIVTILVVIVIYVLFAGFLVFGITRGK